MDNNGKVISMMNGVPTATELMQKSYERMLNAQRNFSDLAVARGIEIAKDSGIDLSASHILGVSFTEEMAVVAMVYQPKILMGPDDKGEPKQVNIPVPAECLWPQDDSWKELYHKKLEEAAQAVANMNTDGVPS